MKITRKQLRKLILEVYKPGSKADLYDRYGMSGNEQEFISDLSKSDDPDFKAQGRELAWDAYKMPIIENESYTLMWQMNDAIADMGTWISDITHDMSRNKLFPDGAKDSDTYFQNIYLQKTFGIGMPKIKSRTTEVLKSNSDPHNAAKLRKAFGAFMKNWDDLSQEALENMGYYSDI